MSPLLLYVRLVLLQVPRGAACQGQSPHAVVVQRGGVLARQPPVDFRIRHVLTISKRPSCNAQLLPHNSVSARVSPALFHCPSRHAVRPARPGPTHTLPGSLDCSSFMQLQVDQEKKERETQMGENRVSLELHRPFSGPVDSEEYGQYNFGSARSIEQYMVFAGLANPDKLEDRCYQLHWVPFRDPTEIEKLVPGYHMLPDDLVAAHHPQARPQVAQAQQTVVLGRARPHSVQLAEESSTGTAEEQAGSRRRWRARVDSPSERRVVLELDTQFLYVCMAGMAFLWLSGLLVIMRLVGARGRGRSGGR